MSIVEAMNEELDKEVICGLVKQSQSLDEDERESLEEYLRDNSVASEAIKRALNRIGVSVSGSTVARHRKSECSCHTAWGRMT